MNDLPNPKAVFRLFQSRGFSSTVVVRGVTDRRRKGEGGKADRMCIACLCKPVWTSLGVSDGDGGRSRIRQGTGATWGCGMHVHHRQRGLKPCATGREIGSSLILSESQFWGSELPCPAPTSIDAISP
uniref:Uncharacterized protein n=1 Tax=Panagrellus redivivus TaxID=6233 RepID=A0A7E4UQK1_PANRE